MKPLLPFAAAIAALAVAGGCGSDAAPQGQDFEFSDGLSAMLVPVEDGNLGRDEMARIVGAQVFRFRVQMPSGRPVLRVALEAWSGGRTQDVAHLTFRTENSPANVMVGIEPMGSLQTTARSVKYFFRIDSQGTSSVEKSLLRNKYLQRLATPTVASDDRLLLLVADKDEARAKKENPIVDDVEVAYLLRLDAFEK